MNVQFAIYDDHGAILRTGSCPPFMLDLQIRDGEHLLEGRADARRQKVVGGKVVDKSAEEMAEQHAREAARMERYRTKDRPVTILSSEWTDLLARVQALEASMGGRP